MPDVIKHLSGQEYRNAMELTTNAFSDPDAGVRLTASITLGRLGGPSAIAALQTAIAAEQDATVQKAMLEQLKRLKTSQQG